ncbi:hypothetical protein ACJIZ3_007013 [Penstemon smallii]|uniref:Uncharacterized protein n=1 Tax=Penstemon smallii TaxID=265156 RepID=A0ABD3S9B1_9LAMI
MLRAKSNQNGRETLQVGAQHLQDQKTFQGRSSFQLQKGCTQNCFPCNQPNFQDTSPICFAASGEETMTVLTSPSCRCINDDPYFNAKSLKVRWGGL